MTYVKINGITYPAVINGTLNDRAWDGRESKDITLEMNHGDAAALFVDGLAWSIVMDTVKSVEQTKEDGSLEIVEVAAQEEYDNSEYDMAGPITDNRDGTVSVKMGKPTAEELLAELMEVLNNEVETV